jgi:hypothetical protein
MLPFNVYLERFGPLAHHLGRYTRLSRLYVYPLGCMWRVPQGFGLPRRGGTFLMVVVM